MQCHSSSDTFTRADNRIRCIPSGMGGNSEGSGGDNRRIVVSEQTGLPFNCLELLAAAMAVKKFSKDQKKCHDSTENRQHINQDLHQPLWGDTFTLQECSDSGVMEMVHRETDFSDSRAPPRREQPHCWYRVQKCEGQMRLDASPSPIYSLRSTRSSAHWK